MRWSFTKGHGTQNDFVILPDLQAELTMTAPLVKAVTDRRAGVGADGVLRVVPTAAIPEVADQASTALWFMDYLNADGTPAQMCGNGIRVFAAYLVREGLAELGPMRIATRAGVKHVHPLVTADLPAQVSVDSPWFAVDLGFWRLLHGMRALADGGDARVSVSGLPGAVPAISVEVGNPHTVVLLPAAEDLSRLDLSVPPVVKPIPPEGSNVEFVVVDHASTGDWGAIQMRVHERGVGETRSCGTGAAVAAMATRSWLALAGSAPDRWVVTVPGGQVIVRALPENHVELAGPAVLVADGTVELILAA
ncbi:MAG: diaminopimelate epimerase [Actinomycetota bacterium]